MSDPPTDPRIHAEPQLRGGPFPPDPSEQRGDEARRRSSDTDLTPEQRLQHSVWDEPALSPELLGARGPDELTYGSWLQSRRAGTTRAASWGVTLLVALAAGPWAVVGTFWGSGQTWFSALAVVVFAPLVEELMKIAAALYVVEQKPYLFRSPVQILICVLAGGLAFSAIENVLYQYVYIPNPTPGIIRWRWTVCVVLHVGCAGIAGLGLRRMWCDTWRHLHRPRMALAYPYILTAVVVHGTYNAFATLLEALDYHF